MAKYKQVRQHGGYSETRNKIAKKVGRFWEGLIPDFWRDTQSSWVISTWEDNGYIIHCREQSHHNMCEKTPNIKFIGMGKWVKVDD